MSHELANVQEQDGLPKIFEDLLELEPKFITNYVPSNEKEQKRAFMSGEVRNPNFTYPKLDAIDFDETKTRIGQIGLAIQSHSDVNPKQKPAYEAFITEYLAKTRLLQLAHEYKDPSNSARRDEIASEYMTLNIELFGQPEEETYRSLLQEKLAALNQKNFTGEAQAMRDELFEMTNFDENAQTPERFKPSEETVNWMHDTATTLYEGMLSHVPEREGKFKVEECQRIFQEIIDEEFGEAAEGWVVDVEPATSINVKASEKRIVIPEDRKDIPYATLRKLVVHEIGVHVLRAIMGSETDLYPLQIGLNNYLDAEEGIAKVMEQALTKKVEESGVDHYITAGGAYYDHRDFRDLFEIRWRMEALDAHSGQDELDGEAVAKAKDKAFKGVQRIMRGTDELPWFKDLSYYVGSMQMWQHFEAIRGDDLKFTFVLMGKANPADIAHERILYETKTV